MDTRSKIVADGAAWPDFARPLAVATGYFDVLRAEHARELWKARQESGAATLLAIILPRTGELLAISARAELVAALRVVDWVTCARVDAEHLIGTLRPDCVVRLEAGDERRSRELRERVAASVLTGDRK